MTSKLSLARISCSCLAMAATGFAGTSLQDAVDLDPQSLEISASTWTCETGGSHDGVDVAISLPIGDDESAGFKVTIVGPDTVLF
jgi:hypothetical protein